MGIREGFTEKEAFEGKRQLGFGKVAWESKHLSTQENHSHWSVEGSTVIRE